MLTDFPAKITRPLVDAALAVLSSTSTAVRVFLAGIVYLACVKPVINIYRERITVCVAPSQTGSC